jgi:nucleoside-diphosphate-sugar epimerase
MPAVMQGKVAIFGAGGPVGAMAARALRDHYTLRLTDLRPIAEIVAENQPQSPRAPLPEVLAAPHECRVVDVSDYAQVLEAARGMDALINVTVLRHVLRPAFEVNLVGAYNVAKAAAELGIRRLIHTGPWHTHLGHNADYWWDFGVSPDVPLRPGSDLYALTKFLGGEVVRVFAEQHGLEVITFLYCNFMPADGGRWRTREGGPGGCGPFVTSWEDTGEAFLYGLRAPTLPEPYEPFFIVANTPHSKFLATKAKRLLGWEARHRFEHLWQRDAATEDVENAEKG